MKSTRPPVLHAEVRPREVWGWMMFDFANSGYTTVVITAVFNAYFVSVVAEKAVWATFAWTLALSISYVLVAVGAPLIGAYADAHAAKKRLLAWSTIGCVAGTAALSLVGPGDLALGVALLIVSNFFFGCGENLAAAFLPEIARGKALGKVSGWGWALGYIGGLVSLAASLAYVTWAQAQGQSGSEFVPVTMVITALLFAVSALPTFLFLRERSPLQPRAVGARTVHLRDSAKPCAMQGSTAISGACWCVSSSIRQACRPSSPWPRFTPNRPCISLHSRPSP